MKTWEWYPFQGWSGSVTEIVGMGIMAILIAGAFTLTITLARKQGTTRIATTSNAINETPHTQRKTPSLVLSQLRITTLRTYKNRMAIIVPTM